MERRDFLKAAAVAAGTAAAPKGLMAQAVPSTSGTVRRAEAPGMIYRELGTTGERVSAIGLGGAHIGGRMSPEESTPLIRRAIDQGVTFLDNCWDYGNGKSEENMGLALRDGYRDKIFLMTKMDGRTKDAYTRQLDESLRRLQTDHIDLVQFHEIIRLEDPDRIFAEGGALEGALAARQAGKIRYIGFTGHKDPYVHLRMLETAQRHNFHFDTAQMPINVMDAHFRSFLNEVVPVARKQGVGVLAMKTLGGGVILHSNTVKAPEALRFALSQPVSVVIAGMDSDRILDQALDVARTFKPMSATEIAGVLARTREAAATGKFELFKTSDRFDGTAKNPSWLT